MKAIRLTRLYIQFYAFNTNMNISGGDRLSLTALQRRLSKLCQKLPQKAILGLGEPIINSRILSGGFYLSQHLSITTKVQYMVYHFCKNDKYNFACILLCYVHNVLKWLKMSHFTLIYIPIHFYTFLYTHIHLYTFLYIVCTIFLLMRQFRWFSNTVSFSQANLRRFIIWSKEKKMKNEEQQLVEKEEVVVHCSSESEGTQNGTLEQ